MPTSLNVLLVEDNENDARLILKELEAAGYEVSWTRVETAAGMSAALETNSWNLVLCDDAIQGFGALEALEVLRNRGLDLPFIIVSGPAGEARMVEAMRARRAAEEELRRAQKMEAIGQLAGGLAHDFNNLLTAILGYSDLLAGEVGPGSPLLGSIDEIRRSGERAALLTQQLLAFSRRQVVEPKTLDLNALVKNLEKMVRRAIGEDIELVTALDPTIGRVRADPGQLEQVILNLAVNAHDVMPKGGTLTIETKSEDLDESDARDHVNVRPGPCVMFAVTDTGSGMVAETASHIFEPFFTPMGMGKGIGLGLATVFGIVKQNGGHIRVDSELGRGTTFKVYLPRTEKEIDKASNAGPASAIQGTETILLVEDEDAVRNLIGAILMMNGYTVLEAGGAGRALETARSYAGTIHLLLTDVFMPQMGGTELASQICAARSAIKVIYMSGDTDDAIIRQGFRREGTHFLQKPFTPETVIAKVRAVLDS